MKTLCTKCKEIVDCIFDKEIIDQDSGEDVIRYYVMCPNCGYKITYCISDKAYREMQAHYNKLSKSFYRATIQNKPQVQINCIAQKQNNYLKSIMNPYQKQLRKKYDGRSDDNADKESISNSKGC